MGKNWFEIDDRLLLMRAVCHEDRRALAILYLKYAPQVRSYIVSEVSAVADIEDLVQDVFLQVCQGKGRYDSSKGVKPYIFGIAKNMIRKYQREKERSAQTIRTDSINGLFPRYRIRERTDPAGWISVQRLKRIIADIETALPPKAREAVRLRFVEGLSAKEAAAKAGCSMGAFYARLERAAKTLREIARRQQ